MGLDNDMTAKKRILAFEIGTFFTRYVVFEKTGAWAFAGTIATPVDGEERLLPGAGAVLFSKRACPS